MPYRPRNNQRKCTVKGCTNQHRAKGLCRVHYAAIWYAAHKQSAMPKVGVGYTYRNGKRICSVPKCRNSHTSNGVCAKHYIASRYEKNSDILKYMTKPSPSFNLAYGSYQNMLQRCYNKNCVIYRWYGARGIKVCDRWLESFDNFLADMGKKAPGLTLERIDNDGNYEPSNCRWATRLEQNQNRGPRFSRDGE